MNSKFFYLVNHLPDVDNPEPSTSVGFKKSSSTDTVHTQRESFDLLANKRGGFSDYPVETQNIQPESTEELTTYCVIS